MKVLIKLNKSLTSSEKNLINRNRFKEFGKSEIKNFNKDYEPNTKWFFLKEGKDIIAFGGLRPIEVDYNGKKYKINGFCSIISIKKGMGHGKAIIQEMIKYLKRTGKTGLGFCGRQNMQFYEKAGLKTKLHLIKKFVYRDPKTGKEIRDKDGDGLYYEGKDKLITKILTNKGMAYINVLHW